MLIDLRSEAVQNIKMLFLKMVAYMQQTSNKTTSYDIFWQNLQNSQTVWFTFNQKLI